MGLTDQDMLNDGRYDEKEIGHEKLMGKKEDLVGGPEGVLEVDRPEY